MAAVFDLVLGLFFMIQGQRSRAGGASRLLVTIMIKYKRDRENADFQWDICYIFLPFIYISGAVIVMGFYILS